MFTHLNLGRQNEYVNPFKAVCISKIVESVEVDYDEAPVTIPVIKSSRKVQYLPGERLLKTINKSGKKKK